MKVGGCSGHAEMLTAYNYDSVCTAIDTELYKLAAFEMLAEAGVHVFVNTLLVGAVAAGFAGFKGLDFLGDITNVGTLVAFGLICITVIYLRFARPTLNRPFKMPAWLAILIAAMGAIMCFILFMSLMSNPHMRQFFGWYLAGGVVVYFIYGIWNSKLGRGIAVTGHEQPNPTQPNQ